MPFLTETLADFAVSHPAADIPDAVWKAARRSVLDTIAACLGGVPTENAATMRKAARAAFGPGPARAWFTDEPGLHPLGALFANCAAASALDIDDGHRGAAGHPGAAIIPAVLMSAIADERSGEDALLAIIIGYEVGLRIAESRVLTEDTSFASGIWTGYGVAAALGRLRGLTAKETAHAIAIAGAEAPANLPQGACMTSSVKGSSPWSTVTASVAVERARCGATGSLDLLNRPANFRTGEVAAKLGDRWLITETYYKPYAACRYTHPVIDAILTLKAEHDLAPDTIDAIKIEIFSEAEKLPNAAAPVSLEDAQFSIPFTAALAAVRGISAFRPLDPQSLNDRQTLQLAKRITTAYPDEMAGLFPLGTPARVTLICGDRKFSHYIPMPLGDATNPLSDGALRQKLFDLGKRLLPSGDLSALATEIDGLRASAVPLFRRLASL